VDFELYEASARLAWFTEASPLPEWFRNFYQAQVMAHTIRTWHPIIIPGPLRISDYARVLVEVTAQRKHIGIQVVPPKRAMAQVELQRVERRRLHRGRQRCRWHSGQGHQAPPLAWQGAGDLVQR
jgi:hypothetical protein